VSIFEYISVLSSIIIGLGIAQILRGVVEIIHHPEDGKPYLIHLGWVASTLMLSIVWWWFQFNLAEVDQWSVGSYIFLIAYSLTVYLMCAVLFPSRIASFGDYKEFFYSKKHWFFGLFILQNVVDIVDTLIKGGVDRILSFGPEYWINSPLQIILAGVAISTRNEKFHAVFAIATILQQGFIAFRLFPTMG